jgi:hypothetical protein
MKTYPKVPRYDHSSVDPSFFDAEDLVVLEKLDGGNSRVFVYDERYADLYPDEIEQFEPEHGEILFGSSGVIQGQVSKPASSFDGNFDRVVTHLRETIDPDELLELHDEKNSPLVLFGENMVMHTLDYEYENNPPPAFVGFDVFRMVEYEEPPENPFKEDFKGFLPVDDAFKLFENIGVETSPVIEQVDAGFNPNSFEVPKSKYAPIKAEGVIIRSDQANRRVKLRTRKFRELNKQAWGMREDQAESGSELFTARYVTNPRIRKHIKGKVAKGEPLSHELVTEIVIADVWEEEWMEISKISLAIDTEEVYKRVSDRCSEVISTMKLNATLNDRGMEDLWSNFSDTEQSTVEGFDVEDSELEQLRNVVEENSTTESGLARTLIPPVPIHNEAERIAEANERDIDRWVIRPTYESMKEKLWVENTRYLATYPDPYTPNEINQELLKYVREELELREDINIDEKPESWTPDVSGSDLSGMKDMF